MIGELTKLYDEYVDTYREADGELPVMMRLKRVHTGFVVKNAEEIADGEGFTAEERGLKVIIAAAGGAAHLGGVLAAATVLPVIGIPVAGGALNGLDALYATVQMPSGVPVATVACGSAGPTNAALLAVQILGTADADLRKKFHDHKEELKKKVAAANEKIHK